MENPYEAPKVDNRWPTLNREPSAKGSGRFWRWYVFFHCIVVAIVPIAIMTAGQGHILPDYVYSLPTPIVNFSGAFVGPAFLINITMFVAAIRRRNPRLLLVVSDAVLSIVHLLIALPGIR